MNDNCKLCGGDSGGYPYCRSCDEWRASVDPTQVAEVEQLRAALAEAAARLDRLGDGSYMTEWSSSGEAGENRFRCAYAREAAAAARAALTGIPRTTGR